MRASRNWAERLRILLRIRSQLIGGAVVAVLLPVILRGRFGPWSEMSASMRNTILGTLVAMAAGAYLWRRMANYPGVRTMTLLLPAFAASYGALALFFFLTRLDYVRFQFVSSFVLALLWFALIGAIESRLKRQRIAVLPFGNVDTLFDVRQADWVPMETPEALPAGVTGVVADLRADMPADWQRLIADVSLAGMPVYHSKQIYETLTGKVQIEHLSENTFGSLLPSSAYLRLKRLIDFLMALVALPFAIVVAIPVAVAIKQEDGGPVFYRQTRMGYQGRPFSVLKFRTMRDGAEAGPAFTRADDGRITRAGRVLRRYRIDELPQIVNVLRGEMSWIGPRPEALKLATWYEREIPFYVYRHVVRPGITGWAQVNQGNVAEIKAATSKLHYDFYYIKHFSPWLDMLVAARTVRIVLTGFGAR